MFQRLKNENVEYDDTIVDNLILTYYPDIRRIIGMLQSRVKDNKLITNGVGNADESMIISSIRDLCKSFPNKQTIKEKVKVVHQVISNCDIDYKLIYQKVFESPEIPMWAKVIVNDYANKHEFCMLQAMNFMSCIYQIIQSGNDLLKAMRK